MKIIALIFWMFMLDSFCAICQVAIFYSVISDDRFNGLVSEGGYITLSRLTGNNKAVCGTSCISMTDCVSFFLDTSTSQCQFHDTVLQNTTGLTNLSTSLYYTISVGCPYGWIVYQRRCYYFDVGVERTFDETKTLCKDYGGEVLRVDDDKESQFLKSHLQNLDYTVLGFWIGLTDIQNHGTWVWNETGQQPTHTDWGAAANQPGLNTEHCALIFMETLLWHDVTCEHPLHPACRMQL